VAVVPSQKHVKQNSSRRTRNFKKNVPVLQRKALGSRNPRVKAMEMPEVLNPARRERPTLATYIRVERVEFLVPR
jgi:hypothetical protein